MATGRSEGRTRAPRMRVEPAFTLVELLLVLLILALMAGMAVPRYAGFLAAERADATVRRITTDLAFAQRRAGFTGTAHSVSFDSTANTYELIGIDDPSHPGQPYVVSLGEEPYGATLVSASIGGDAILIFNGYGDPDSAGTVVIKVGTITKTIHIDPDAGVRKVQEFIQVIE